MRQTEIASHRGGAPSAPSPVLDPKDSTLGCGSSLLHCKISVALTAWFRSAWGHQAKYSPRAFLVLIQSGLEAVRVPCRRRTVALAWSGLSTTPPPGPCVVAGARPLFPLGDLFTLMISIALSPAWRCSLARDGSVTEDRYDERTGSRVFESPWGGRTCIACFRPLHPLSKLKPVSLACAQFFAGAFATSPADRSSAPSGRALSLNPTTTACS
jgi:hypothetical protein